MKIEPEPESSLSLSFLDTLSCGLGGAIALFMVFIVMPHQGITRTGKTNQTQGDASEIRRAGLIDPNGIKSKNATMMITITFLETDQWIASALDNLSAKDWIEKNVVVHGVSPINSRGANPPELSFPTTDKTAGIRIMISGGQRPSSRIQVQIPQLEFERKLTVNVQVAGPINAPPEFTIANAQPATIEIDVTKDAENMISGITKTQVATQSP